MNKYSIILPVFNGGELFKLCVKSILAQTLNDLNLIVLDNKSTDGSLEWLMSLPDDRIMIHPSETRLSIEQNWGRISSIEKGEFITLIGHDDILHPHYLAEMNSLIQRHPNATLYQSHFDYIDKNGNKLYPSKPMDEKQYSHEFIACQFARTIDSTGTGYMMRSKDYDDEGGISIEYPKLIFADYELWSKLTARGYKATSKKFCFEYRIHDSVSKLTNGDEYQQAFERYIHFLISLASQNADVKYVLDNYGHGFLMYYCESLSHRLLKTPFESRKINVSQYIDKCILLADKFIPGQKFEPLKKREISLAKMLDQNEMGRSAFRLFKRIKR